MPASPDDLDHLAENGEGGLPLAIAAAWGLRQESAKGPKRGLTIGRIVQVAVQVALDEGTSAVSMNRVAAELGVTGMSLYRYFSGKNELVDLMVDHAFGPAPEPPAPDAHWRAALHGWAAGQLAVLRTHPWIIDAPISGSPITPNLVSWFEHGLRCLTATSLAEGEKVLVVELVSNLVRSVATLEVQASKSSPADLAALGAVIDERRFPAVFRVLQASVLGAEDGRQDNLDPDFEFGMNRILDGINVYMTAMRPEQGSDP